MTTAIYENVQIYNIHLTSLGHHYGAVKLKKVMMWV